MKHTRISLYILAIALLSAIQSTAQSYVPRDGQIRHQVLQATKDRPIHAINTVPFTPHHYALFRSINLDTAQPMHVTTLPHQHWERA